MAYKASNESLYSTNKEFNINGDKYYNKSAKNHSGGELLVIILGIVVIVLFIYLGYVLVQPEKF